MATAFARSAGSANMDRMIARVLGIRVDPPTPRSARATMSHSALGA
jgi:hypothetical protein